LAKAKATAQSGHFATIYTSSILYLHTPDYSPTTFAAMSINVGINGFGRIGR
jgi:hypothetical protein